MYINELILPRVCVCVSNGCVYVMHARDPLIHNAHCMRTNVPYVHVRHCAHNQAARSSNKYNESCLIFIFLFKNLFELILIGRIGQ